MHVFYVTKENPMTWTCFADSTDMKADHHRHEIRIFKPHFSRIHLVDPSSFDPHSATTKRKKCVPLAPLKTLPVKDIPTIRKNQLLNILAPAVTDEAI
jgi:hypothetical protein